MDAPTAGRTDGPEWMRDPGSRYLDSSPTERRRHETHPIVRPPRAWPSAPIDGIPTQRTEWEPTLTGSNTVVDRYDEGERGGCVRPA